MIHRRLFLFIRMGIFILFTAGVAMGDQDQRKDTGPAAQERLDALYECEEKRQNLIRRRSLLYKFAKEYLSDGEY